MLVDFFFFQISIETFASSTSLTNKCGFHIKYKQNQRVKKVNALL